MICERSALWSYETVTGSRTSRNAKNKIAPAHAVKPVVRIIYGSLISIPVWLFRNIFENLTDNDSSVFVDCHASNDFSSSVVLHDLTRLSVNRRLKVRVSLAAQFG